MFFKWVVSHPPYISYYIYTPSDDGGGDADAADDDGGGGGDDCGGDGDGDHGEATEHIPTRQREGA